MTARTATAKPADDDVFDFNLDTLKSEVELLPFRVHFGGKRWVFTNMQALDAWDLLAAAADGDAGAVVGAMKLALGDQWDDFRKLGMPQWKVMPLFNAWKKHSGAEPGESKASSDS